MGCFGDDRAIERAVFGQLVKCILPHTTSAIAGGRGGSGESLRRLPVNASAQGVLGDIVAWQRPIPPPPSRKSACGSRDRRYARQEGRRRSSAGGHPGNPGSVHSRKLLTVEQTESSNESDARGKIPLLRTDTLSHLSIYELATLLPDLLRSAEGGDPEAQSALGQLYHHGVGVGQDDQESIRWYRKAAEQGHPVGQFELGLHAISEGLSPQEGVYWLKQAAKQDIWCGTIAQLLLGTLYEDGYLVPRDYPEAMKWYRQGAELGDSICQYNLGLMYHQGKGTSQDYREAVKWFRGAAEQGCAISRLQLAILYKKGLGVPENWGEAYKWATLAVEGFKGEIAETFRLSPSVPFLRRAILWLRSVLSPRPVHQKAQLLRASKLRKRLEKEMSAGQRRKATISLAEEKAKARKAAYRT